MNETFIGKNERKFFQILVMKIVCKKLLMWTFCCIEPLSCNLDFFHNFHAIWGNKSLNIFWGKTDYQTNKLTFF